MTSVAISLAIEPKNNAGFRAFGAIGARRAQWPCGRGRPRSMKQWRFSLIAIGLWSAIIAASISTYVDPAPRIHDEFSNLLAADTILHGRLANPTPAAWEALQSFHTVMQPSYASKYPVASGLLVAIGWVLLGIPLASSWLAAGMMAVCITWMLAGVLPKRWAIMGGVIISFSPFIQLVWAQSLLHGFLPASGSALLMGGVLRLRRRVQLTSAFASGCGVGLLAMSRPFEGLFCTLICTAVLWSAWNQHSLWVRSKLALQVSAFACAPVLAALAIIAAHNHSVTGNWRHLPYQLHEAQYGVAPIFVFDRPKLENAARRADLPKVFYDFHAVDSLKCYLDRVGWSGWFLGVNAAKSELLKLAFPFFGIFAISGLKWARFRLSRGLLLAIAFQVAASASVCWVYAHYLAPILPWLLLLSLLALRTAIHSRSTIHARIAGLTLPAILLIQVACIGVFASVAKSNEAESWSRRRQEIVERLCEQPGKHLIFVRYNENHNVHQEWVYNLAEPSASKIVWSRFEDGRWINSLLSEYSDRVVWIIDADDPNPKLKEFSKELKENSSDTSRH